MLIACLLDSWLASPRNGTLPYLIMFVVFQQVIMSFSGGAGVLIFV